jgi:hypothetical protein
VAVAQIDLDENWCPHQEVVRLSPEERRTSQWHRVLVRCAVALMSYHDEIRVFSRLMAKCVVRNDQ